MIGVRRQSKQPVRRRWGPLPAKRPTTDRRQRVGAKRRFAPISGQALVEFALILPLLALILMGIFDLGRAFYAYNVVANAAREGARAGVIATATDADIRAAVRRYAIGLEPIPDAKITIIPSGSRISGGTITVRVEYDFTAVTPLIDTFLPNGKLTLSSIATMRVE